YKSQSKLGALISVGVAAMLTFQTFENLGMCLGVAPVIGLTLPFFSSGGSSVVTSFACMGIISGRKMKPKPVMFTRR
ncbi:MAG: FtsW/RodA/SpoVE family cell cycle protein, partial [Oscillospiraceae bacterium]|nr:FtsW/RodA/SpoVE family cell cycle protein [Oscillospiraceae bacterium]